jgi:hypothetical protein
MRRHFEESKLWGIIPSEGDVEELKESVKPSIMIVLYHYTSISTVSTRVRAELSITSSDVHQQNRPTVPGSGTDWECCAKFRIY